MPNADRTEVAASTGRRWLGRVRDIAKRYDLPGVGVAVAHRGRAVWSAGVGVADMRTGRLVRADSVFRLASITKLFTATAVLILADEGRLSVDDPVRKHVGEFPDRRITVRHLLAHGGGLQRETPDDPGWRTGEFLAGAELLAAFRKAGRPFSPLERWKYSNLGYTALGEVVERVSGVPYARFVTERVIEPLGMGSTAFDPAGLPASRITKGYRRTIDGDVEPEPSANDPVPDAPGQLFSTAPDLVRMVGLLCGDLGAESPIRPETIEAMRKPQIMVDGAWKQGHGLGPMLFRVGDRVLAGHAGGLWGHAGWLLSWPDRHVGAIALTNIGDGELLFKMVVDLVREAGDVVRAEGLEPAEAPDDSPAPEDVRGLLGRYWGDTLDFRVRWRGGRIEVRLPPRKGLPARPSMRARLVGRDQLLFDGGPYVGEIAQLDRDVDGRVTGWEVCTYRFDRVD
jgi:CubicO group peptidase (beta-lactamase class C family)